MRTKLRSKFTLLFMTFAVMLAIPAVALADNLQDSLTGGRPSATITQNDSTGASVNYWLEATQSNGCDASSTNPVTVGLQNLPAGVTATPNQITFNKCTDAAGTDATAKKSIKWTSSAVSPSTGFAIDSPNFYVVSGTTSMNFNNAKFTLFVNPAPTPTDSTAPVIGYNLDPASPDGANGWYTSNVNVNWTVVDNESDISSQSGCDDFSVTTDQNAVEYTCTATSAGGTSSEKVTIKRDATAPTINDDGTTQSPNGADWFNTAVVNDFSASDATSGLANSGKADFSKSSGAAEGNAVRINSGPVSDNAGNTNQGIDSAPFKIDLTKPTVSVTDVANGDTYTTGNVPTPGCNTTDGLSGVKEHASVSVTGGTGGFGNLTATCSGAVDNADNAQADPVSVTYGVKAAFDGFLQPIDGHSVNTGKYGRTYPIKWQLRDSSGALIGDTTAQLLVGTMTGGQKAVSCTSFDLGDTDALEASTTGNTALRYDATSDQFIYNYKAPSSGSCYVFAIRNADGLTTQQIDFKFTK